MQLQGLEEGAAVVTNFKHGEGQLAAAVLGPPCDWRTEIAFAQSHAKAPASWLRRDPAVLRRGPVLDQVLLHCGPMRGDRCGVLARVFTCALHAYLNIKLCLNSHDAADRNAIVPPPCQNFCAMQSGCIT